MTSTNSTASARRRRALALLAAAGAAIATAGTVAGCTAPSPTESTDSGTVIQVVAAESVWGEVAAQIGGPQVHVTDIIGGSDTAGGDLQAFQPSPADTKAIAGAQVFILNGAGLDPWANQAAAADPGVGRLDINVGNNVGVTPGQDPYLWFDSDYVNATVQQIEQDFTQLRPAQAAYFAQQVAAFEQSTAATDESLAGMIKQQFKGKAVGVCPGMAQQVATALGLTPVAAAADQIGTGKQIKVLLCEAQGADPADTTLLQAAATAKIPVVQLSQTLAPAGTTFQAWLTAQLNQLDVALTHA